MFWLIIICVCECAWCVCVFVRASMVCVSVHGVFVSVHGAHVCMLLLSCAGWPGQADLYSHPIEFELLL